MGEVGTKPTMKERLRDFREDTILDAAMDLLVTKGFATMTLEDITETVGISKPTLYQHFKSKEDIVLHVKSRCLREANEFLASLKPEDSASKKINQMLVWSLETRFGPNRAVFQDFSQCIVPSLDPESPVYREESTLIRSICELFEQGQAEKAIRTDVPPSMLTAMFLGFVKNWRVDDLIRDGQVTLKEICDGWNDLLELDRGR